MADGIIYFCNFKAAKSRKTCFTINGARYELQNSAATGCEWVGKKTYKITLPYGKYEIKYHYVSDMDGRDVSDTTKPVSVELSPSKPTVWIVKKLGFLELYLVEVPEFKIS